MKTQFTESLIRANRLNSELFRKWVFAPGMLFQSQDKWWGDRSRRGTLHEGLDLCLYQDQSGQVFPLTTDTKIPVMFDGIVANIIDDFLGKSIIVEHRISSEKILYTFYGHCVPDSNLKVDDQILSGKIIGTISAAKVRNPNILPHLHITICESNLPIPRNELQWKHLSNSSLLRLLDPIDFIGYDYRILRSPTSINGNMDL